ncbi:MAG TPA: TetR family transcriptional regulator C-terminal domain-containing protein [Magnetospirillaceae bacterium]|jgi:TetR/AcrR family transcriptional repressor of bet genes
MPKKVDVDAQRQAIAGAAIEVIGQAGLDGARLRDVARAAHVTTGAVTHYFDGKDAVLEAALGEIVRRTLERMERPAKAPRDLAVFIAGVCTYLPIDERGRQEWRVWLAFWGRAIADERLRAIHRDYYARIIEGLRDPLLALRGARARPSPSRIRHCADALVAAIDGIGIRATLEAEHWPAKRQRATLTSLLIPLLTIFMTGAE